jgi:hypothetical protein
MRGENLLVRMVFPAQDALASGVDQPSVLPWNQGHILKQCCGSMTFSGGSGSGSADPCLWLMDPDPDRHWPYQDANKKLVFFVFYFLKVHVHHFERYKVKKKSQSSRNKGFSSFFCLVIEGSRSRSGSGFGSATLYWTQKKHNLFCFSAYLYTGSRIVSNCIHKNKKACGCGPRIPKPQWNTV